MVLLKFLDQIPMWGVGRLPTYNTKQFSEVGVQEFNSIMALLGDSIRFHRLKVQLYETAPASWLQMRVTSFKLLPALLTNRLQIRGSSDPLLSLN